MKTKISIISAVIIMLFVNISNSIGRGGGSVGLDPGDIANCYVEPDTPAGKGCVQGQNETEDDYCLRGAGPLCQGHIGGD